MARTIGLVFNKEPKPLGSFTVEHLKALAVENGIEFDAKVKKADLIALLESKEKESEEDGE
jgi:hypothetical protein